MDNNQTGVRLALVFCLLALALSVPFYGLGPQSIFPASWPIRLPATALMTIVPIALAVVLTFAESGSRAVGRPFDGLFGFRRAGPVWLAVSILILPALYYLSYLTQLALGVALPASTPITSAFMSFAVLFVLAIFEEVGWTGYVAPRLQARWGALNAALFIGLICAVWHLYPYVDAGRSPAWLVGQFITIFASRIMILWLFNNTGGALLTAVLFHAMSNVSYRMMPLNGSHYDPVMLAVWMAPAAVLIVVLWGPRTLADFRGRGTQAIASS